MRAVRSAGEARGAEMGSSRLWVPRRVRDLILWALPAVRVVDFRLGDYLEEETRKIRTTMS